MTTKRFMIIGDDNMEFIMQTQILLPIYDNKERLSLKTCCDLLNELHEKNERLKEYNSKLMKQPLLFDVQTIPNTMEIIEANSKLEKENEQLKQQEKRLYNYFRKCFDNVSEQGFQETWEVVKKYD